MKTILIFCFISIGFVMTAHAQTNDPKHPKGMVYVPAGSFIMGSKYGDPDERPQHIDTTNAYFIDQYEVSNAEYAQFDPKYSYPDSSRDYPVILTWERANAYAQWAGKRLPSEKEWEKAARGTDGRIFPWGNTFDNTYVVWNHHSPRGSAIAKPTSPYGCYDMAGSVWEWTADWYKPYPGNDVPMKQYGETYKVMRGGSNFNNYSFLRTTERYYLLPNITSRYFVGFRCVKDIE
ncbi:MAG: SUMF1/EgtB/PvdO family nonheme iron enzyme [Ginsengibacter sp.]